VWILLIVLGVCVVLPVMSCVFWGGWAWIDGAFD
jgi:hypothetical protein